MVLRLCLEWWRNHLAKFSATRIFPKLYLLIVHKIWLNIRERGISLCSAALSALPGPEHLEGDTEINAPTKECEAPSTKTSIFSETRTRAAGIHHWGRFIHHLTEWLTQSTTHTSGSSRPVRPECWTMGQDTSFTLSGFSTQHIPLWKKFMHHLTEWLIQSTIIPSRAHFVALSLNTEGQWIDVLTKGAKHWHQHITWHSG